MISMHMLHVPEIHRAGYNKNSYNDYERNSILRSFDSSCTSTRISQLIDPACQVMLAMFDAVMEEQRRRPTTPTVTFTFALPRQLH